MHENITNNDKYTIKGTKPKNKRKQNEKHKKTKKNKNDIKHEETNAQ